MQRFRRVGVCSFRTAWLLPVSYPCTRPRAVRHRRIRTLRSARSQPAVAARVIVSGLPAHLVFCQNLKAR